MLFGSHKRLVSSDFGRMLSAGTIGFEEFEMGGGGRFQDGMLWKEK